MKFSLPLLLLLVFTEVAQPVEYKIGLPDGWAYCGPVAEGPEGSFSILAEYPKEPVRSIENGISARLQKSSARYTELSREEFETKSGLKGLKISYDVETYGNTYRSPHYFFLTPEGRLRCVKVIPSSSDYEGNARFIENLVITIEQLR